MRVFGNIFAVLLFFLFATPSTAEIKYTKIESDSHDQILFDRFGFTNTGYVSVSISSVSVTSVPVTSNISRPDPSRFGFFLLSQEARSHVYRESQQNPNLCVLDSKFISLLFTFRDLSLPLRPSFNKTYAVTYPDYYSLSFANCNPLSHVTMDVRVELYNMDEDNTKDYVSAELKQLQSLYSIFIRIYVCFLVFWIFLCFKNQPYIHSIHVLMGGLLFMRALNLVLAAEAHHHLKVTGVPRGWDLLFFKFLFIKVVLLVMLFNCSVRFFPIEDDTVLINDGKTGRIYSCDSNLRRQLFEVGFAYLAVGRLGILGLMAADYNLDQWVYNVTDEIMSLVFYIVVFGMLRPAIHKGEDMAERYVEFSVPVFAFMLVNLI